MVWQSFVGPSSNRAKETIILKKAAFRIFLKFLARATGAMERGRELLVRGRRNEISSKKRRGKGGKGRARTGN